MRRTWTVAVTTVALLLGMTLPLGASTAAAAVATAVVDTAACTRNELVRNDDNYTDRVPLPFVVNYFGETYTSLWVNNNGNVTFDSPLSTFTPFGLTGTQRKIIAPFFADVDTRGSGSQPVRYGWGTTTYEGHDAFCVNWVDVGYYDRQSDKLNSFQMLLVRREDSGREGDFDIVFNYGKVQWETGSASGGVGGLGGSSARAGFSNGSGREGTSFEIPGSGVPGSLLDSSTIGLARTSTDSTVRGRHVWLVRGGAAPATRYVALGDSFQSGEGDAGRYEDGTDREGVNECHRSTRAYPHLLFRDGLVPSEPDFGACSGATTGDLYVPRSSSRPPWDDGRSQLERLGQDTRLVTIGVGGNDVDFASVLTSCITSFPISNLRSCQRASGATVDASQARLASTRSATRLDALQEVYREVRRRAPRARVLVVGYPRFYTRTGSSEVFGVTNFCSGVRITDQRWINQEIRDLNATIKASARSLGAEYVDVYDATGGHELCGGGAEALNGIVLDGISPQPESYHPNALGHELLAGAFGRSISAPRPGTTYQVRQGQTQRQVVQVPRGRASATFSTSWPGSDVVMSLRSPSGRVVERGTVADDVLHEVGPTSEVYSVTDPEAGEWTVSLFGAQVAAQGEPTLLETSTQERANTAPAASLTSSVQGRTVTVDARASRDVDGRIEQYLWDFGDGTTAAGPTAEHAYATPGEYRVTLAVTDDDGDSGFASDARTVRVAAPSAYDTRGPYVQEVKQAGSTSITAGTRVPFFLSVAGRRAVSIIAVPPTSQRVECTSGSPSGAAVPTRKTSLTATPFEEAGRDRTLLTYGWATDAAWAGQCRKLTVTLDDGSAATTIVRFRP